jgi:hypothetical protein
MEKRKNPFPYAEIKPVFSVRHPIALPAYSLTYLSSNNVKILDHGSPTRGPPGCIWRSAAKSLKYVYTTQITQDFSYTIGIAFIVTFPCAAQEPNQNKGGRPFGRASIGWLNASGHVCCSTNNPRLQFAASKFLAKFPNAPHLPSHFVVFFCL